MQMLKKIFKSDSKYYLELDEALESKPVQQAVKTAKKAADVVQDKAAEALESNPVQQVVDTAKQAADVAQDKLPSALTSDAKSAAKSAKNQVESVASDAKAEAKSAAKSAKKTVEGKEKDNSKVQAKPSPQQAGASSFEPPFWVAAMYKNNSADVNSDGTKAEQTFATENLMPTITKYRRRPGPSLNKFRDMAGKTRNPRG